MTTEDRLNDIEDYIQFLDTLYEEVKQSLQNPNVKIHVLGFSQGAATATRWVGNNVSGMDSLILWSGMFPPDLDLGLKADAFKKFVIIRYVKETRRAH